MIPPLFTVYHQPFTVSHSVVYALCDLTWPRGTSFLWLNKPFVHTGVAPRLSSGLQLLRLIPFFDPFQFEDRRQRVSQSDNTFHRLPKFQGLFYEPCCKQGPKKHRCPDCHFCQECSPSRCNVCQDATAKPRCKPSLQEQIAIYEQTNTNTD